MSHKYVSKGGNGTVRANSGGKHIKLEYNRPGEYGELKRHGRKLVVTTLGPNGSTSKVVFKGPQINALKAMLKNVGELD